jgi:CHAD domain-containing protein
MLRLYKRFRMDRAHAEHVADLCDRIFVELPHLHGLPKPYRALVRWTALLHDIAEAGGSTAPRSKASGSKTDPPPSTGKEGHDVRGARRIAAVRIEGLRPDWKPIIAQATALHSARSDLRPFLARLKREGSVELELAGRVAAVLRIGDGLDHCRAQDTHIAAVLDDGDRVEILVDPAPSAEENARFALRKADLWNRLALRPIHRIAVRQGKLPGDELVSPDQPVGEAARRILQRQFELLASRRYGVSCWEEPEYVHEMRVAARRLRSAIEAFRKPLGRAAKELGRRVSRLAQSLGGVRDLDVFLEYVEEYARAAPPSHRPALRTILAARGRRRQALRREAAAAFAGSEYRDVESALRPIVRPLAAPGPPRPGKPAWREARRSLREYLDRILAYGRDVGLKKLSPPRQHLVRIDCKKFRYLAEFLECFYGRPLRDAVKVAVELQDLLGTVHDSYVYAGWLGEEAQRLGGRGEAAIGGLLEHLARERQDCLNEAGRIWKSFTGKRSRKRLARILKSPRRR